jgi:hypothetical protein
VLILPAIGIVTEIIANNTRKPIWGYKMMVGAIFTLAFLSFIVWAHHMYMTGMGAKVSAFFQTTTIIIRCRQVILLTALLLSLWGGSIRFTTPMLFATAFLPMFGIGGLTGIPLAFNAVDLYLHDTYYIIAHFHYIVAPGTIFAIFAGVYYWFPKATGRMMNEFLGKLHFWGSLIFINGVFGPMFLQGMTGMHRRWYDGGEVSSRRSAKSFTGTGGSPCPPGCSASRSFPFIFNFLYSIFAGKRVTSDNPWDATTLEWETPSPPGHGNFTKPIHVYRGPYEYSVPGADKDYSPQAEPPPAVPTSLRRRTSLRPPLTDDGNSLTQSPRVRIPGLANPKLGIWLFLASEVMLFGGLFSCYIFQRIGAEPGYWPHGLLNVPIGFGNTLILIASSVTVILAWASLKMRKFNQYMWFMLATIACGVIFLGVKLTFEWPPKLGHFGAILKKEALVKYEGFLGNEHLAERKLEPRVEISGHLLPPESTRTTL